MAALVYGVTPLLIRLAIIGGDLGTGVAGGLVSYLAATAAVALLLLWPGQLRHALAITPESLKWFTYSGISVSIAQMFIYMAYAVAPISVVTPILQLHLVLRLVFARVLNPHHEIFGGGWCWGHFCRCSAQSHSPSISSTCWPWCRCRRRSPRSRAGIGRETARIAATPIPGQAAMRNAPVTAPAAMLTHTKPRDGRFANKMAKRSCCKRSCRKRSC